MGAALSRILLFALLAFSGPTSAATFTVTKTANTNDGVCDADCSVREAVVAANASPGLDDITIPSGSYIVSPGLLLTDDVRVLGAGMSQTLLDGVDLIRPITQLSHLSVEIEDLAVVRGVGGAIRSTGPLTLTRVRVADSLGGGIEASGGLVVADSLIENNERPLTAITLGGGLWIHSEPATVTGTVIRGNRAYAGGGVAAETNFFVGDVTLQDCVVEDNEASIGGGVWGSHINLIRTAVVFNETFIVDTSAFKGDGGGAFLTEHASIENSTFSGNTAAGRGGALVVSGGPGLITLDFSTIASNSAVGGGDGINNFGSPVEVMGSVIDGDAPDECAGTYTSLGYNVADASCGLNDPTDSTGPAGLLPLTVSFGTQLHPLDNASAAADAADTPSCPAEDQRGVTRPIDVLGGGAICDAGAYEAETLGPSPVPALPWGWLVVGVTALGATLVASERVNAARARLARLEQGRESAAGNMGVKSGALALEESVRDQSES